MKTAYRTLALVIAGLVALQAATHAWSSAGAARYLADGGTLDLSATGGPLPFVEIWGIIIHTISGMYLIPAVAVILVVVGYLSHLTKALSYALIIAVLVAAQVALGMAAPALTFLAFLHGVNALLIFGVALFAAYQVHSQETTPASIPREHSPKIRSGRVMSKRSKIAGDGEPVVGSGV